MKFCPKCFTEKSESDFNKCISKKDGLESNCRQCKKQRYLANREAYLAKVKLRYEQKKEDILAKKNTRYASNKTVISEKRKLERKLHPQKEAYEQSTRRFRIKQKVVKILGGGCAQCDVNDILVLCIDHIHNDGKCDRAATNSITLMRNIIKHGDQGKYQCLCFNCNLRKEILKDRYHEQIGALKECSTCKKILDKSFFNKHPKGLEGIYNKCRNCIRKKALDLKIRACATLGTTKCGCGVDDILVLSIDHVNEDGYSSRSEGLGSKLYSAIVNKKVDLTRFQVLCMNCNLQKHFRHKNYLLAKNKVAALGTVNPKLAQRLPKSKPQLMDRSNQEFQDFEFTKIRIERSMSTDQAAAFLDQYHYAGFGRSASVAYNVLLGDELVAVVKFCPPIRQGIADTLEVSAEQLMELDRFCIHPARHKKNFASYTMSRVFKMLKRDFPQLSKLVSFADPRFGHEGIMYRSSNWEYHGKTSPSYYYQDKLGNEVNKKTLYTFARNRKMKEREYMVAFGYQKIMTPPKHKYSYNL